MPQPQPMGSVVMAVELPPLGSVVMAVELLCTGGPSEKKTKLEIQLENYPFRYGFSDEDRKTQGVVGELRVGTVLYVQGNIYRGYPVHNTFIEVTHLSNVIRGIERDTLQWTTIFPDARQKGGYTFGERKARRKPGEDITKSKQVSRQRRIHFAGYNDGSARVKQSGNRISEHQRRHG